MDFPFRDKAKKDSHLATTIAHYPREAGKFEKIFSSGATARRPMS
jgi:hypothetical protein